MFGKKPVVKKLFADTYLAVIKNSIKTRMFRDLYALVDGRRQNVTRSGELSCAFFVSAVLTMFGLSKECYGTVNATVRDVRASGWKQARTPAIGDILVWEKIDGHRHIGFYIGNHRAVSNSTSKRYPVAHHWTFGTVRGQPKRRVEEIWRNGKFKDGE